MRAILLTLAMSILLEASSFAATNSADQHLAHYFRHETDAIAQRCLADIRTLQDWNARRGEYRRQLFEMLSLDPLPDRTDLRAQVTGRVEHDSFIVENLHFQSMPGLYVTGNLYLPKGLKQLAPTVLYVCGHGPVITNGVSYGNKVAYQHHGAWFARNGYICLLIDTLQLGEIQGLHHGTHREGMWWWNSRGYTPAGVEAWNSIRSLDYLSTRPEVDTNRFGVTGRSGGGAYSWWLAALDDRIKVAAPVAGITDLHNHVVDGVVEGHCDCMFTVNTHRWDYPQVASLVAPRPLLIVNTDSDSIFPLDGVARTHKKVRAIYRLHNAATNLGLVIGPGPHKDTQDLQVPVFRWFNRHLKGEDPPIEMAATKLFTPQQLKVFARLPDDAINTNIQNTFVPMANHIAVPGNESLWRQQREIWMSELRQKAFAGWPQEPVRIIANTRSSTTRDGVKLEVIEFLSQPHQPVRLYLLSHESSTAPRRIVLRTLGDNETGPAFDDWVYSMKDRFAAELSEELEAASRPVMADRALLNFSAISNTLFVIMAPRGVGAGSWSGDTREQRHIRRRFMLLGQTLDAMRVWDIRQAIRLTRERWSNIPLALEGAGNMAVNTLYAGLFENGVDQLRLWNPPASHMEGPDHLNVLRVADLPQTVAMAADRCSVRLETSAPGSWDYARQLASRLSWPKSKLEIVKAQP